jgi:hypothetical protein
VENRLSYHRQRYDKSPLAAILPFARCNFAQVKHKFRARIMNMMSKFISPLQEKPEALQASSFLQNTYSLKKLIRMTGEIK